MKKFLHLVWDDDNVWHIGGHQVSPDEVEQVLYGSNMVRRGREQGIYLVLGQTDAGRYLFAAVRDFGRGVGRVITARDMDDKERNLFKRR
jgi:hypothetical protein